MPSHLPLLVTAKERAAVAAIIRDFKKFTYRSILHLIQAEPESRREWLMQRFRYAGKHLQRVTNYKFWQDGYHPIELTSNAMQQQKLNYLHRNPVTDGTVAEPAHYVFSSSSNYPGQGGLLEVLWLE
ncbi:hypothetical protein BH24BAC1_BH24BAC1_23640 [soil metagenome]